MLTLDIKSELFNTIFWEGTPLHDGAVIIKDDRVVCAAAFFPPTQKDLSPIYGARHRAALGISEITDSLTVVVSEETGTISFAIKGELIKIPRKELRASLVNELGWFKSEDEEGDEGCTGRLYQKEDQEKSHDSSDHHGGIREEVYEA